MIQYTPVADDGTQCDVTIRYTLKDGRTVTRYYEVGRNSPLGERAGKYFSDMRYIFEVQNTDLLYGAFEYAYFNIYSESGATEFKLTKEEEIRGLLDAIKADCDAGTMVQNWAYHEEDPAKYDMDMKYQISHHVEFGAKDSALDELGWNQRIQYLTIYPNCVNTLAYMETTLELFPQAKAPQ